MASEKTIPKLLGTKLKSYVVTNKKFVTISGDTTLSQALKILHSNKLYAAPVYTKKSFWGDPEDFTGFLDLTDLVYWIIKAFEEMNEILGDNVEAMNLDTDRGLRLGVQSAASAVDLSKRNIFITLPTDKTLEDAMRKIVVYFHARRIVIVNGKKPVGILSAGDIISIWSQNLELLPKFGETTIKEALSKCFRAVHTIKKTEKAFDGFRTMVEQNISGLAVVDEEDKLWNVLSAKDLKRLEGSLFNVVFRSVEDFIAEKVKFQTEFVFVQPDDTMKDLVDKFVKFKMHRIFIVDENRKVIGVISGSDVVSVIADHVKLSNNDNKKNKN